MSSGGPKFPIGPVPGALPLFRALGSRVTFLSARPPIWEGQTRQQIWNEKVNEFGGLGNKNTGNLSGVHNFDSFIHVFKWREPNPKIFWIRFEPAFRQISINQICVGFRVWKPKRAKESMVKIRYLLQAKTKGGGGGVHNLFVLPSGKLT